MRLLLLSAEATAVTVDVKFSDNKCDDDDDEDEDADDDNNDNDENDSVVGDDDDDDDVRGNDDCVYDVVRGVCDSTQEITSQNETCFGLLWSRHRALTIDFIFTIIHARNYYVLILQSFSSLLVSPVKSIIKPTVLYNKIFDRLLSRFWCLKTLIKRVKRF